MPLPIESYEPRQQEDPKRRVRLMMVGMTETHYFRVEKLVSETEEDKVIGESNNIGSIVDAARVFDEWCTELDKELGMPTYETGD